MVFEHTADVRITNWTKINPGPYNLKHHLADLGLDKMVAFNYFNVYGGIYSRMYMATMGMPAGPSCAMVSVQSTCFETPSSVPALPVTFDGLPAMSTLDVYFLPGMD